MKYFYGLDESKKAAWRQPVLGGPTEFSCRLQMPLDGADDKDAVHFMFADGETVPIAACTVERYKQ